MGDNPENTMLMLSGICRKLPCENPPVFAIGGRSQMFMSPRRGGCIGKGLEDSLFHVGNFRWGYEIGVVGGRQSIAFG